LTCQLRMTTSNTQLCGFYQSTNWEQLTTGVFNPDKSLLENGQVKCGEQNLGTVRTNHDTCELCQLVSHASRALKPWWPIAEFLDQPERITCAFFNGRNRLGSGVRTSGISQTQTLIDQLFAQLNPNYSSQNLVKQEFFDSLGERGALLDGPVSTSGSPRRNNTLNCLLVLADLASVKSTAQTFMQLHPCPHPIPTVEDYANGTNPFTAFPTGRIVQPKVNVRLLRRWFDACLENHGSACDQPSWLAPGETWPRNLRLIDVSQRCIVDALTACPYFTLSYVWGSEQNAVQSTTQNAVQSTTQNLAALQAPGALASSSSYSLPKTIEDAL
jgi:hypothetical protein